ncbi:inverse autotransporter beta domain-containing protein, partial [Citrobacter sp. VF227]
YTLGGGETAASVAKKFHLTLDQLREINQLRTFAHGLNGLRAGNDVDVPLMTARDKKTVSGTSTASPSTDGTSVPLPEGDEQVQKMAGYASQAGSVLAASVKSEAVTSMARGLATGTASGEIRQWLSHFGTARVQLDADKNFSLKNSQFDLLIPLYDRGDNLVFTQGSLHRTDGRTQANLGAGLRHFMPGHMLGGNLFGDYDLSRDHARVGAGLEYWRDFLKLGVNGYYRLTDWKDSPDRADYEARPANGWDVRAQAWVPSLPQLGGRLTYEQYYGKEVALFGVDNRQKNPHAITAGINYTPVPLITLGAEQRQGPSGKSDTRLTLDVNYQLGVPWRSQVSPDAVAAMRTLTGSRYDLAERNNHIVLEYRKQELVKLALSTDSIAGAAGTTHALAATVSSKYGVQSVSVAAGSFLAAGGVVTPQGTSHFSLTLPPYRVTQQAQVVKKDIRPADATDQNIYTLTVTAEDQRGNSAPAKSVTVTVLPPELSIEGSLQVNNDNAPADGTSVVTVTALIGDSNGHIVADQQVVFAMSYPDGRSDTQTVVTDAQGRAVVDITSVVAGTTTVTATVGAVAKSVPVHFVATGIVASHSTLTVSPSSVIADGRATATLSLRARDIENNPVAGKAAELSFPATGVSVSITAASESPVGSGHYTAQISGTQAGTVTLGVALRGSTTGGLSSPLTLIADDSTAGITTPGAGLTTETDNAVADGTASNTVKAVVADIRGNPVAGVAVGFSADNGATIAGTGTTGADGSVTQSLTSTTAGLSTVTATVNGSSATTATHFVADDGNLSTILSALTAVPATIVATGRDASLITLVLKDVNGNPVAGRAVTLTGSLTGTTTGAVTDHGDGTYTAELTGTAAGSTTVSAQVNGSAFGVSPVTVTLTAPPPQIMSGTVSVNGATFALDSGFPTTGFMGASFRIQPGGSDANNNQYIWSSDQSWVSVAGTGVVTFTGTATRATKTVTITATPVAGGAPLTYAFTLKGWYINDGDAIRSWSDANMYCSSQSGYSLPTIVQLTNDTWRKSSGAKGQDQTRAANAGLWSEWGNLTSYSGAGFSGTSYWSSEQSSSDYNYYVFLNVGVVYHDVNTIMIYSVCRQGL